MIQKPPSERSLWRAVRNGHEPLPADVAARLLRALNRYELKWPKDGQELLQLGWVIEELGVLLIKQNQRPTPEQIYLGWKRIEKAAEKISSLSLSIDFYLSRWAEDLVYRAAKCAANAREHVARTRQCAFCWKTAHRTIRGWPNCRDHLPNQLAGRRMRKLAIRLGNGDLRLGMTKFRTLLVTRQQRVFNRYRLKMESFTERQANYLDPVANPWWATGKGIHELFGPGFLYVRYKATEALLNSLSKLGGRQKRVAAKRGGRPGKWKTGAHDRAIGLLHTDMSLRDIEARTGVSKSTLSRLKQSLGSDDKKRRPLTRGSISK